VFRHAVEKLAQTAETALEKCGLSHDDIDWIVPHQANLRIIAGHREEDGRAMDRVIVTVQDHGNTSAASIPLALSVGLRRARSSAAIWLCPRPLAAALPGVRW
jgi:3-oxoacyl-[acyl-carrier-protein] synthase-3